MNPVSELSYEDIFNPEVYGSGDPLTFGLPLDLYDRLRSEAPCVKLELENPLLIDEVWVCSRHEDIWNIDRDPETFAANIKHPLVWTYAPLDPTIKPGLLVQDGKEHSEKRGMINKAFRPVVVQRLEQKFRRYSKEILDEALEKETVNFVDDIAHQLPVRALGDILGIPISDQPKFFAWVDTFASPFDTRVTPSFEKTAEALMALWEYGLDLVKLRKDDPGDDVMSMIAQMNLGDDEIQGNVALFASGAAETTRAALCHGMQALFDNPEQMEWLRERADDVPGSVAQEFVRIGNPIVSLLRVTTREVQMHGQTIPKGDSVAMFFAGGNFDPEAFEDPRKFDVSRDPNDHLGFGRGPHACIGKHIAALEIKILMEELLRRTKSIEPAGEIDYVVDNYARGVYSLPVTLVPA